MSIQSRNVNRIVLFSILLMILTAIHHYHASILYQSPWRLHVLQVSVVVIIITLLSFAIYYKWRNTLLGKISLLLLFIVTLSVCWIGIYEGFYNHIVKNIVFLIGLPESITSTMYPPDIYSPPSNLFYEITGAIQFGFTVMLIRYFYRYFKQRTRVDES